MKKPAYFSLFFAIVFCFTSVFASNIPNGIKIIKQGSNYLINFNLPQIQFESVNIEGQNYLRMSIDGYGVMAEAGLPALPQITFNLLLNSGETIPQIHIQNLISETSNLTEKVFPFQPPWEKNRPIDERPFMKNSAYYLTEGNTDQPFVKISEPFIIGGAKGVRVTLFPFMYNPSANLLTYVSEGSFTINLTSNSFLDFIPVEAFNSLYDEIFVNYEKSMVSTTGNYLIITAPEYEAGLAPFVAHKTTKGFNVTLVTTAVTGTSTASIKTYLDNLYADPQTKPDFVLLVGDKDKIPGWVGDGAGSPYTDLHYALMEGSDYYADLFIGRFPITDDTELNNIIAKTIYMENNIGSLDKKACFMASVDNYSISEGTHNYVIDNYFDPAGYTNLKLYQVTYGATTQDVIDAFNDNQIFGIYSGHGSTTSWADGPPLNQAQVRALTNTYYPFIYSFACVTGDYEYGECFGETWIRTTNGGATFYGSSVNSYWDEDDILEKELFKAWYQDELTQVTPMYDKGKYYLVNYYGGFSSTMIRYVEMYNCLGDPSLDTENALHTIQHTPLTNTEDQDGPYTVNATITPSSKALDPSSLKVFYGKDANPLIELPLTNVSGDDYTADIPGDGTPGTYNYYIVAADVDGQFVFAPGTAPAEYYSFTAEIDITPPQIVHTPLSDVALVYWPISVLADVTDGVGVAEVKCTFKVNDGVESDFVLPNVGGNIFEAPFPIDQGDLTENDVISYFLSATDNAIAGNMGRLPETGFYTFTLIDVVGYILVLDDDPDTRIVTTDEKGIYTREKNSYGKSAAEIVNLLQSKNYAVDTEPLESSDFTAWTNYDLLILSSASNQDPVDNAAMRAELVSYVQNGGKILVEGGEVGYDYRNDKDFAFRDEVLHITGWIADDGNNLGETDPNHFICGDPNDMPNPIVLEADPNWWAVDALTVAPDAYSVYDWTLNGLQGVIICDQFIADERYSQIVFYAFDLLTIVSENDRNCLLENTVTYLMNNGIVPVELTSFAASVFDSRVNLSWTTATETNNKGFEIERIIADDKSARWENIGYIDGNGTVSEQKNYTFSDNLVNINSTQLKYRLKQIDFDGAISYSDEIEVELIPFKYSLEQNYPNPFNPSTKIKYSLAAQSQVILTVYNILGEQVASLVNQIQKPGNYEFEWFAANLPSSVYIYTLEANDLSGDKKFRATKKLILLK